MEEEMHMNKFEYTVTTPISVYVQGGKTHISTLLPTSIVQFFPHAGIEGIAAEVENEVLNIVDAAR